MSINNTTIAKGDFKSLKLGDGELEMLEDAYQAVTNANRWGYLSRKDVPGSKPCVHCEGHNCHGRVVTSSGDRCFCKDQCRICQGKGSVEQGFMFNDAQEIRDIDLQMKYGGHSGSSYGWTMRNMEYIAKKGWDAYVDFKGVKPNYTPPPASHTITQTLAQGAIIDDAIQEAKDKNAVGFLEFAKVLQGNAKIREVIPDIDQQIEGFYRYDKAVKDAQKNPNTWKQSAGFPYPCPCRKAQGKQGWCGVAGFGVPACEH